MASNFEKLFGITSKEYHAAADRKFGGKNNKVDNDVEVMIVKKDRKKFVKKYDGPAADANKAWAKKLVSGGSAPKQTKMQSVARAGKKAGESAASKIKAVNKKGSKMSYSERHKFYAKKSAKDAYKKYSK